MKARTVVTAAAVALAAFAAAGWIAPVLDRPADCARIASQTLDRTMSAASTSPVVEVCP
jgi:hypothetical protein